MIKGSEGRGQDGGVLVLHDLSVSLEQPNLVRYFVRRIKNVAEIKTNLN